MSVPQIAIVGRPNVGKSSLFNWLAGHRVAIVDPTAGVTRDRVSTLIESDAGVFELVDTGGMGIQDADGLTEFVEGQIESALQQAQVLLFVVDARAGVIPADEDVAQRIRALGKPIVCAANKCDTPQMDVLAADFHRLGFDPVIAVSARQRRGKQALVEALAQKLPAEPVETKADEVVMKLAIVGRRNTGKSTFINQLAQAERMIVSEVPGTTRDSVDVRFERDGKTFIAIDTAGVRRKGSIQTSIEFYSLARAERSIRRADVVLLFLDASKPISKVDKQLATYVLDHYKPAIFVVNKWDLLRPRPTGEFADYLQRAIPNLDYLPIAFATAKTGKNVQAVLNLAQNLFKQAGVRVPTGDLNRTVRRALETQAPPLKQNRRPKIFFATQVDIRPPTIVLFCNDPELFSPTYKRYLVNYFRDHLPYGEIPIKLEFRRRRETDTEIPREDIRDSAALSSRQKRRQESFELWND
ncbi:MAG: GTPase Der [Gemmatales bacterium]|nr:MAG: GTPase Der [Gemmatales bacterium]